MNVEKTIQLHGLMGQLSVQKRLLRIFANSFAKMSLDSSERDYDEQHYKSIGDFASYQAILDLVDDIDQTVNKIEDVLNV